VLILFVPVRSHIFAR